MPRPAFMTSLIIILGCLIAVSSPLSAQEGAWKLYSHPSPRTDVALAPMDSSGGIMLFGGADGTKFHGDTWKFYSGSWTRILRPGPSPRSRAAIAWDSERKVVVLFGGLSRDGALGDTWEWDGRLWRQKARSQRNVPSAREGAAMVYDADRAVVVLFGGKDSTSFLSDTWEWNGSAWRFVTVLKPPQPRYKHAMAWCENAGGIIMFGGLNVTQDIGDTWKWDGQIWQQLAVNGPSAREAAAMAPLPDGDVLLVGGANGARVYRDSWQFDGSIWTKIKGRGPTKRAGAGLAIIAPTNQMLLFGGWNNGVVNDDTWTRSGTSWNSLKYFSPSPRAGAAMNWDPLRQRLVLFGGLDAKGNYLADTWEWNRFTGWHRPLATGPGARAGAAMAWDPARKALILNGGRRQYVEGEPFTWTDTWAFDGNAWTLLDADGPEASGALAWSAAHGYPVMLEGGDYPEPAGTYQLKETGWQPIDSADTPEKRTRTRMAAGSEGIYLFGGYGYHWSHMWPILHRDLWLLNGEGWQQIEAEKPDARQDHLLGCLPGGMGLILHGGSAIGRDPNSWSELYSFLWKSLPDTWRWDGGTWRLASALGPSREGHALAWIDALNAFVFFGGMERNLTDANQYFNDLWIFDAGYGNSGAFDIGVLKVTSGADTWYPGDQVTVTAQIASKGPGDPPAMLLHLYLSLDERLDDRDILIGSNEAAATSPSSGETNLKTILSVNNVVGRIPQAMKTAAQRNRFYVIAALDEFERTGDRDRSDNIRATDWYITIEY